MAVCLKNTAIHILVFLLGKNYVVIHLELKCSVRMGILFFYLQCGFWGVYLGQGFFFFILVFFYCGSQSVIRHLNIPEECTVPLVVLAIGCPYLTANLL